jgi:hypothetical protein
MGAFVRGGMPGMEFLDKVYLRILQHYEVGDDTDVVFEALGIFVNPKQNKIMRKWVEEGEDGSSDVCPSSQK